MTVILIPAYEPTERLGLLVRQLRRSAPEMPVLVVDDGSGCGWAPRFDEALSAGALLLHEPHRGKGGALKAGLRYLRDVHPDHDVVTADSDGQHTPRDILRVAAALAESAGAIVLGCRGFDGSVPWRSRLGNTVASIGFRVAAGLAVSDTQTGLRGLPAASVPWLLTVPGERFEWEQRVLLRSAAEGWPVREVPIETVYLDGNAGTHFRPVADSLRVLLPVIGFAASSLLGFVIDTVVLVAAVALTGALVPSIVLARVLSASVNFAVNRRLVFRRRGGGVARQAMGYAVLAGALLTANVLAMSALDALGVPLLAAKVLTEAALFVLSYLVQRRVVFARRRRAARVPGGGASPVLGRYP